MIRTISGAGGGTAADGVQKHEDDPECKGGGPD